MATYVWTSAQSGNWSNQAPWSPVGVPGSADAAIIEATGADFTVTISSNVAVQALTVSDDDATISLGGVTLAASTYSNGAGSTLAGFGTVAAEYSGAGAIVAEGGVLDFTIADNVFSGAISGTGTLELAANAVLDAPSITVSHLEIEGAGVTVTVDDALTFSGSLLLGAGAIFSIADDVTVSGTDTFSGAVSGAGALDVTGGATAFQAGATLGVDELLMSGGSVTFNESLTFAGSVNQAGGTISIGVGDVLTLGGGDDGFAGIVTGSGTLDLSGAGEATFGVTTLTVGALVVGGDEALTFDDDVTYAGTLDERGGTLQIGTTLALSGVDTLSGAVSGGELDITAGVTTVTAAGSLALRTVKVSAGATLEIESSDDDLFEIVSNSGVILVETDGGDQAGIVSFDDVLTQTGKGKVEIGDNSTVAFNANVKGGSIDFGPGRDELLEVDDSTIAVSSGKTIKFGAKIKNFGFGDSIGIAGATVKKVSQSESGGDTLLHVTTSDDDIVLTLVGDYSNLDFGFKASNTGVDDVITVSPLNATPVFSGAGVTAKYHEAGAPVTVDAKLGLAPDIAEVSHAKVAISSGFVKGDALEWVAIGGVVGVYNEDKGVLKFSGDASAATYAAILDSITFSSTSSKTKTRTLTFTATSGGFASAPVTTMVKVLSGAADTIASSAAPTSMQAAHDLISGAAPAHEASLALWAPRSEASQAGWLAGASSG